MTGAKTDRRYLVPGLVRGVEILRLFSRSRRVISAPDMARELGIPRSTVFRLAQTLEHLGLLERTSENRSYRLGIGLLGLGFDYLATLDVTEIGRDALEKLRDDTGFAVHMVVRDGTEVVVVLKVPGLSSFSGALSLGTRLPAHATVLGRTMLADLSADELEALYGGRELETFSPQTPRTLADLRPLLDGDKARGFAVSRSFFESGISTVAAPVRDHTGHVVAAINVTIPGEAPVPDDIVAAVCDCAADISTAMNYSAGTDRATA
jgi:DNA-binding IclR family transcriptional regulator